MLQVAEEVPDRGVVCDEGDLAFSIMFVRRPQIAHLGYRTGERGWALPKDPLKGWDSSVPAPFRYCILLPSPPFPSA